MKRLIVNADDCNLTRGVTQSILDAHHHGILTSTTFLINLTCYAPEIKKLKAARQLGIGLHLNITLGSPVSRPQSVKSLLRQDVFKRPADYRTGLPKAAEVFFEYENQIKRFKKVFGRLPTHLDTHHQLHDQVFFLRILSRLARQYQLPVRRSVLMNAKHRPPRLGLNGLRSSDFLTGNLDPRHFWRKTSLLKALKTLPDGLSEIMCHPGLEDRELAQISSFQKGRLCERDVLMHREILKEIDRQGIELTHYGLCYT